MGRAVLPGLLLIVFTVTVTSSIVDFETKNQMQVQDGVPGENVDGTYFWISPENYAFLVRYVADEKGYRVVESNAVPINADGVAADGSQGAMEDSSTS
ncbi:uncharacterized protein LOC135212557 [Macrobrachium nipponense]|uniref:uncharacterized protein LOC135212557 n=1 Tax=Macrobrachium nipponense TaxID=159736 RepID=UPI0030C80A4F